MQDMSFKMIEGQVLPKDATQRECKSPDDLSHVAARMSLQCTEFSVHHMPNDVAAILRLAALLEP